MIEPIPDSHPAAAIPRKLAPSSLAIGGAIVLVLAAGMVDLLSDTVADPDLWGHLRFGQDIVKSGSIIQVDTYSYLTQGQPWINHEWLAELLFAVAFDAGGVAGLVWLKTLSCLATLGLVWHRVAREGFKPVEAGLFTMVLTGMAVPWMAAVRPQIFSYLGFAVVLVLLARAREGRTRALLGLPLVFVFWTNLHGGFLAGLVVLTAWVAARLAIERPDRREGVLLLVVLMGSLMAPMVNPYGWRLPAFLLRTATVPRPEIDDWQPLRLSTLEGVATVAVMALTVGLIATSRRPRDYPMLLVLAIVGVGPFVAHRHIPLAMLGLAVGSSPAALDFRSRFNPTVEDSPPRLAWAMAVLFAVLGLVLVVVAIPHFGVIRLTRPAIAVPVRAVATLKAAGVQGNLAVPFSWGEYVLWHLGPGLKVSMDGRRETVYSESIYAENLRFLRGEGRWTDLINRPETDLVLTDRTFPSDRLMAGQAGWVLVYEDDLSRIFARTGTELARSLSSVKAIDAQTLAFPGG